MNTKKEDIIIDCTEYDNEITNNSFIDDQVFVEIVDIDDLVTTWIISDDYKFFNCNQEEQTEFIENVTDIHPKWLWRSGGNHGCGTINLTQWFHNHFKKIFKDKNEFSGYFAIVVYDFEYSSFLLPGGKWSFDAKIIKNGKTIWAKHLFKPSDDNFGIKYIKLFSINIKDKKGHNFKKFLISESIDKKSKNEIIDYLYKNFDYYKHNKKKDINKLERY